MRPPGSLSRATISAAAAPLALAVALAAGGCGGSGGGSSSTVARVSTSSAGPSTTTTTTATATITASPTTSSGGGAPPCTAAHLKLTFLGQQGATDHGELGFAVQNTSDTACSTIGYPGIQFLGQTGDALPTIPQHTTRDFFGHVPLRSLTIAPGQSASFRLGVTHGAAGPAGCVTAYGLQVIAPNDTATMRLTFPSGAFECRTATVSPMAPGDSAFP
jgi:Domain of unknown function (DUF4232)